jgi:hypothetical protein
VQEIARKKKCAWVVTAASRRFRKNRRNVLPPVVHAKRTVRFAPETVGIRIRELPLLSVPVGNIEKSRAKRVSIRKIF